MTTKPTPIERMAAGHAANAEKQAREHKAELAALFWPNERSERLLRIRETDPALFATFGPQALMQVGHYQQQRDAAGYTGDGDSAA